MFSVDANVILRWLLDDVPAQTARTEALLKTTGRLGVADATMIEVVFVLERVVGVPRGVIVESIGSVLAESRFDPDRTHWSRVMNLYHAHPKLSVTDIHLAVRAQERGQVLLTFDTKLANQMESAELL